MIGSALKQHLESGGHEVTSLVRTQPTSSGQAYWDPTKGELDKQALEGVDAVVHLAGENVAEGRWTAAKKDRIRSSREAGTRLLAEAIADSASPPPVLVSASAIGFYGDRGDEFLQESSPPGGGFLAETCQEWELAALPAREAGVRVVHPRIGLVLDGEQGALARMLLPFKMGVGGPIGNGRNWVSWISLTDQVRVLEHAILTESLEGPVNSVSPQPVRFSELARCLGHVLGRPAVLRTPALAMRLVMGQMVDELILSSLRVQPKDRSDSGLSPAS